MPAIWFGTVVLWTVVEQEEKQERAKQEKQQGAKQEKQEGNQEKIDVAVKVVSDLLRPSAYKPVKPKDIENVKVYVRDDGIESEEVKRKILVKYIGNNPELLAAWAKGLLQVYDIDKTTVTPPHI